MNTYQPGEKDISKVFAFLRAQLQAKEKELLQLQRTDPCLLAPETEQIETLVDAITSLQLSTQDGSFVFASSTNYDQTPSPSSVRSNGMNSIKNLPSNVWLSQSNSVKQQREQRPSTFSHLLSVPNNAYLASSWPSTFQKCVIPQNQNNHRARMANHLLCMPLNAFKSTPITAAPVEVKHNKYLAKSVLPTTGGATTTTKSLLHTGAMFSKELWVQNN